MGSPSKKHAPFDINLYVLCSISRRKSEKKEPTPAAAATATPAVAVAHDEKELYSSYVLCHWQKEHSA